MSGKLTGREPVFFCAKCGHSHMGGDRVGFSRGARLYEARPDRCEQLIEVISLDAWRAAIARHNPARLTDAGRDALADSTPKSPLSNEGSAG
jgi:hypothetical protein